jgi:hypothetical protein
MAKSQIFVREVSKKCKELSRLIDGKEIVLPASDLEADDPAQDVAIIAETASDLAYAIRDIFTYESGMSYVGTKKCKK